MVQLHNWGWLLKTFSEVTRNTRKLLRCWTILGGQQSLGYCVKLFVEFLLHNSNFGCMYDDHILVSILEMKGANCLRPRFYRQFTDITGIPCSISPYTWHGLGYTWSGICGTSGTSIENMGPVENTCSENIWFVSYFWLKENNFAVQVYYRCGCERKCSGMKSHQTSNSLLFLQHVSFLLKRNFEAK